MGTQNASKVKKILLTKTKTTLEMKSKNHARKVLKVMPLDLGKTGFRMETLQNITKTKGADKCTQMLKRVSTYRPNP